NSGALQLIVSTWQTTDAVTPELPPDPPVELPPTPDAPPEVPPAPAAVPPAPPVPPFPSFVLELEHAITAKSAIASPQVLTRTTTGASVYPNLHALGSI